MTEFILYIKDDAITNKPVVRKNFTQLRDGKYLVTIKSIKKRSLKQNAYYWSVCVPMVLQGLRDVGYNDVKTNEDAHEVMKRLFLQKKFTNEKTGEEITLAGNSSDLKTVEFNTYLEDIWQWAAEYLNIQIPQPNEQLIMFNGEDDV
jgi:hypothetical protein